MGPIFSPFVLAELDNLLATRVGAEAQHALLREVERGAYRIAQFHSSDVDRALAIMAQFEDLAIGLVDASIVVLSERHSTFGVLTQDERHFRTVTGSAGRSFRLLPADA